MQVKDNFVTAHSHALKDTNKPTNSKKKERNKTHLETYKKIAFPTNHHEICGFHLRELICPLWEGRSVFYINILGK